MAHLLDCLGLVAPYYNIVLVAIVIALFIVFLRNPGKKVYTLPWKLLLAAILVYVVEEILTILHFATIITISPLVAPLLEMIIISLFIYMLLTQREYLKKLK